jgi:hypothetical protein
VRAGLRLLRFLAALVEGLPDLLVQVDPVGHDHHPRVRDALLQRQRLAEQHHRQRFPGALRLPDHAALAAALRVPLAHPLQRAADREVLLVAGDLLHRAALVVDDELARQLDQPLRPA